MHLNNHEIKECNPYECPEYEFYGCDNLKKAVLKDTIIGNFAFKNCTSLEEVKLQPRSTIGSYAFENCNHLTKIDLSNVKKIGMGAFKDCNRLLKIKLPNLVELPQMAFFSTGIRQIKLPITIRYMGGHLFAFCNHLIEFRMPPKCKVIKPYTFLHCRVLKQVDLNQTEVIGMGAFMGCIKLKKIVMPKTVRKIEMNAFDGCFMIEQLRIPEGVETIAQRTFQGCKRLKKLFVPASVTTIYDTAFEGCKELKIICPKGSYAEEWAERHGVKYECKQTQPNSTTEGACE